MGVGLGDTKMQGINQEGGSSLERNKAKKALNRFRQGIRRTRKDEAKGIKKE